MTDTATVSYMGYHAYINSTRWRTRRKNFIKTGLADRCWGCGKRWGSGDHIHHRSYKHLGSELDEELVPLCEPCHRKVHKVFETPKGKKHGLWWATDQVIQTRYMPTPGVESPAPKKRRSSKKSARRATPQRDRLPKLKGLSHRKIAAMVVIED